MGRVNIIGAGLAGLSAALRLAEKGIPCRLISLQRSERAQSVLAEGGINAALDTMGEGDSIRLHYEDTVRGGCELADPNAVDRLTREAPETVKRLFALGAPLEQSEKGLTLRSFGGQKKKRTAFAKSSTGKVLMTALIDEVRKHEASGLVKRYPHHELIRLTVSGGSCTGVLIRDCRTGLCAELSGSVILCSGGLNGLFPGRTTGTTQNTGDAAAALFSQGVQFANLEMIQYHPTTIAIPGKRCLISEAARGEGGRLWIMTKEDKPWYFMEEKYPELGNLMPRDVVSREMFLVRRQDNTVEEVYLDMTGLSPEVWRDRLSDLRDEIIRFTGDDPSYTPITVHEGIHYFMGGVYVDEHHRSSLPGLYAAGECACQYHGANRLGGNSMLGAVVGGRTAAETAAGEYSPAEDSEPVFKAIEGEPLAAPARDAFSESLAEILSGGLGIIRNEQELDKAIAAAGKLKAVNAREKGRLALGLAMLMSAKERRESRGAHYREDYPDRDEGLRRTTVAEYSGSVNILFKDIPERRAQDADKT
ncbi:MAG: FAD-binding protein [Ruminococcus sp.]|nr:FAD-binding protein [Ruminococcus sp.]